MKQLTSLDAQFLGLEDDRQFGHVVSLAVYDPATAPDGMTAATMKALVRDRLSLLTEEDEMGCRTGRGAGAPESTR